MSGRERCGERKVEAERQRESNRLPIFQSHLTCPVLWALLSSGAGEWEASMHTHALRKGGREGRDSICVCVYVCMCVTGSLLMSPLAGNCSDRPIREQGYVSSEGSVGMCMYTCVCVCVMERNTKNKTDRESPSTWSSCYRGDKQSKRDILADCLWTGKKPI